MNKKHLPFRNQLRVWQMLLYRRRQWRGPIYSCLQPQFSRLAPVAGGRAGAEPRPPS